MEDWHLDDNQENEEVFIIEDDKPSFQLGQIVITPGAIELLEQYQRDPYEFISRHMACDWGDLEAEDKAENDFSVANSFRILSSYNLTEEEKIWVITEWDRSYTTILQPSEY